MDLLPSNSFRVQLLALLRSSHALLGLLATLLTVALWLSLTHAFVFGAYCAFFILIAIAVTVCIRFALKGPEVDRGQPVWAISHQENRFEGQFTNIEFGQSGNEQILDMVRQAVGNRRRLPAPVGILQGPASDPASFRPVTPEQGELLSREDAELLEREQVPSIDNGGSAGEMNAATADKN